MAFLELSGTVQANNYHHQETSDSKNIRLEPEPAEVFTHLETEPATGTDQTVKEKSVKVPPDRSGELEEVRNEIKKIEMEMKRLKKADKHDVKEKIRTVPPKTHHRLKMSTRRKNRHEESAKNSEIRKGVKPIGENGVIWKAKIDMKRMFKEKKLLWGAVPPVTTAENESTEKRLLGGAVPPPTTATPAENVSTEKMLKWGAVPPPTMANG